MLNVWIWLGFLEESNFEIYTPPNPMADSDGSVWLVVQGWERLDFVDSDGSVWSLWSLFKSASFQRDQLLHIYPKKKKIYSN